MYLTLFGLEIILSIFLVYAADYTTDTTDTSGIIEDSNLIGNYCYGTEWVAYKDEKCFKLIRKWATRKEAEDICKEERLKSDLYTPTLVSIKSATEQEYLTNFVFNTSGVQINVWIGAIRLPENGNEFVWDDGSVLDFTNWAEGSPSEGIRRDCVEMQSRFTRKFSNISDLNLRGINGKWRDVTCESGNYVICQKLQAWPFPKLQQTFLDARKELKDSLDILTKQLSDTKNQLSDTKNKLEGLEKNPVPIGFIYVQLPNEKSPTEIWPWMTWENITTTYAGLFFRAEGEGSEEFGVVQGENSPRLTKVLRHDALGFWDADLPSGGWSRHFFLSTETGNSNVRSMTFYVSGGEVRPRNMAIRIWKRTG